MRARRSISGAGRLGCLIWLLLLGAVVLVLSKVVPVKMRTSQFFDAMEEQAQFGSIKGDKSIQNELFQKAQDLQLPLKKEDILVHRDGSNVYVEAHYKITIEFPGYTYVWQENPKVIRPLFAT